MVSQAARTVRTSLRGLEGYPVPHASRRGRIGCIALATGAVVLGVTGLLASLLGTPEEGVLAVEHGVVAELDPSGYAWMDGIRVGDRVVSMPASDAPEGGGITVASATGTIESTAADRTRSLRLAFPLALASVVLGLLGLILAVAGRGAWILATCAGLLLAATPLERLGSPSLSTIGLAVAAAAPVGWLGVTLQRHRVARAAAASALLVLAGWVAARLLRLDVYATIEPARAIVGAVGALFLLMVVVARRGLRATWELEPRLTVLDFVVGGTFAVLVLVLVLVVAMPSELVAGLALVALFVYPRGRHSALVALDRILLADVREQAAVEALEDERARISRDLHDTALQEIAGAVHGLNLVPGTEAVSGRLQTAAAQLRGVVVELRPPVLDDLGLAAGLEVLLERAARSGLDVEVHLESPSGDAARPPRDVELATFRVFEEALRNVERHAAATHVTLTGRIERALVELALVDDGRGFDRSELTRAARAGRLGVTSMQSRARLVGATLKLEPLAGGGTLVEYRWTN